MTDTSKSNLRWVKLQEFRKNPDEAFCKLKSSAEEGNNDSYSHLGYAFETGLGISEADYEEALRWYEKAYLEANDVWGAIGLGRLYYLGKGVEVDYERSWKLFKEIEDKEIDYVYLMLGRMSYLGRGVDRDLIAARKYFERAATLGNIWAVKYLGLVEQKLGNYWKGLLLRTKAVWIGAGIAFKDSDDRRLAN